MSIRHTLKKWLGNDYPKFYRILDSDNEIKCVHENGTVVSGYINRGKFVRVIMSCWKVYELKPPVASRIYNVEL